MRLIEANDCKLVLVDYQLKLLPAIDQGQRRLARALWLAGIARAMGVPVLGTEQNPGGLGPNESRLRALCDKTLTKMHFDACVDGLPGMLEQQGKNAGDIVICGCETHVCLMQSAAGLLRAGYRVHLAVDACGSRRNEDRELALQRLQIAGATLVSVEMVAFEWLRTHQHPVFCNVLPMLRAGPDGADGAE